MEFMRREGNSSGRFVVLCHKLINFKIPYKLSFIIIGIASTGWFLIRVIPKPSRATYPCMKAAAPFMSSFVIYLLGISSSALLFRRSGRLLKKAKYVVAAVVFMGSLVLFTFSSNLFPDQVSAAGSIYKAAVPSDFPANQPMGEALGIFPGRVVWEWDADATNEDCTNEYDAPGGPDGYFLAKNNNQDVINRMMDDVVKKLTGSYDVGTAWEKLFTDFNQRKGRGAVTYEPGQKIYIKINQGGAGWLTRSSDLAYGDGWQLNSYPNVETSAPMAISVLEQLVNVYGVLQEDIYIGDPNAHILKDNYDQMVALFPDVKYIDKDPQHADIGRTIIHKSVEPLFFWSDRGTEITPDGAEYTWDIVEEAEYLINLATLKAHARAGVTLTAKNHFGTHARNDGASSLHPGLVSQENWSGPWRTDYGMYRVLTDIMGHDKLGGNTVLFVVEGLWGGPEAVSKPIKWNMAPFNGDWPSSILAAQDAVALESVCFDILKTEFNDPDDIKLRTPWYGGVDDHLHQAADSKNWPAGFIYDPEGDGTPMSSMGIHEHWNNDVDMQYSRNLGYNYGIELITPKSLVSNAVMALEAETIPVIDGDPGDACWSAAEWYHIDETWITWGEEIDSSDYFGRFKLSWSAPGNLLYFLVEITDDAFVDGYVYPDGAYPDFDIVEVFIDEDMSGGLHVFDDNPEWGMNSENAFSYHIAVDAPADGETASDFVVCDIDGTNWPAVIMDYADHFPELSMKKAGNQYYYEFSMAVYDDSYVDSNKEASRVVLVGNKEMAMSMAYCDNDITGTERDNFFGSVWVPEEAFNDHWMNADGFGRVRLIKGSSSPNSAVVVSGTIADYQVNELNTDLVIHDHLLNVFNDPDGDILSYSVSCAESVLAFKVEDNVLKVNASDEFAGSPEVTVVASDGPTSASVSFKITSGTIELVEQIGTINDFALTKLNSFMLVHDNLLEVFSDPKGLGLSYTVSCDQPQLSFSIVMNVLKVKATALLEGAADVTIAATDGKSEASASFRVSTVIVGVSENGQSAELNCYPNPVTDRLYLDINLESAHTGHADVKVFNMAGINIISYTSAYLLGGKGAVTLDMGGEARGFYILQVDTGGEQHSMIITKK